MQNRLVSLPPLDALRGFVAAARRMSITAAADDLCLTQSAVSRQIQTLEERLGTPLFTRSNRSIALTAAGEQLFKLASPWMDKLLDLADSLRQDQRVRPVTVSASMGVASLWLLPRLGEFQSAHPHIDVRVATSNRVLDLGRDGIDLAIRYSPASHATQGGQLLFDEVVAPVAAPSVAASAFRKPEALLQHVLLDLDDKVGPWLHWVAHARGAVNFVAAALETATTVDDALAVANRSGLPAQNFVAGDSKGNIGWTIAGPLPRRAQPGLASTFPLAGETQAAGWNGLLAPDAYPAVRNPADGQLSTANSRQLMGPGHGKLGDGGFDLGARAHQVRGAVAALGPRTDEQGVYSVALDDRALFMAGWRERALAVLDDSDPMVQHLCNQRKRNPQDFSVA
eukprot:gene26999-33654_t